MKYNLPPSPFGAGTTDDGRSRYIVPPEQSPQENTERSLPPRIARSVGMRAVEHSVVIADALPGESEQRAEQEHMQRLFAFPDSRDDRMHMRTSVTDESLRDALDAYVAADDDVKRLVDTFAEGQLMLQRDAAEAIRSNNQLRLALGRHLLDKLNHMPFLPSRLSNDTEIKRPNVDGYDEPMTSKEYAALLAISMLDGTYKNSPGDKIYIDRYGEVKNGQHRYAAQEVLGIDSITRNRERQ